ncbi:hypothetical protein ABZ746_38695 [Streptomyces sp. NPDC020096]
MQEYHPRATKSRTTRRLGNEGGAGAFVWTPPPAAGRLVFHVFAAIAVIRELIVSGIRESLAAHARGKVGGQPTAARSSSAPTSTASRTLRHLN